MKKVIVYGAGISGQGAAEVLTKQGAEVTKLMEEIVMMTVHEK